MAQKAPDSNTPLLTTMAVAAFVLSVFCTVYLIQNLPQVKENTAFYAEEFNRLAKEQDRLARNLDEVRRVQALQAASSPLVAETLALRGALTALESTATTSNGALRAESEAVRLQLETLLKRMDTLAAERAAALNGASGSVAGTGVGSVTDALMASPAPPPAWASTASEVAPTAVPVAPASPPPPSAVGPVPTTAPSVAPLWSLPQPTTAPTVDPYRPEATVPDTTPVSASTPSPGTNGVITTP